MFDVLDIVHNAADRSSPSFSSTDPDDMKQVRKHIHQFAVASETFIPALLVSIHREVTTFSSQTNTLFRSNTSTTSAMEFAMASYGKAWLEESIGKVIRRIVTENVQVEVDLPSLERRAKATSTGKDGTHGSLELVNAAKELDANVRALAYWFEEIWASIINARGDCPKYVRCLVLNLRRAFTSPPSKCIANCAYSSRESAFWSTSAGRRQPTRIECITLSPKRSSPRRTTVVVIRTVVHHRMVTQTQRTTHPTKRT